MSQRGIFANIIIISMLATFMVPSISFAQLKNISFILQQLTEKKASQPEQALAELEQLEKNHSDFLDADKLRLYRIKAEILCDLSHYYRCKDIALHGITVAKSLDRPSEILSELYYQLGFAYESLGDLAIAEKQYLLGLDIAKSLEQPKQIAYGLTNIGAIYYQTYREDLSLVALHDALAIAKTVNDQKLLGYIYSELGILYGNLGNFEQSIVYYQKSYETYLNEKSYIYAYNNARNLGVNYANMGEYQQAIAAYKNIIDNQDKIKNPELLFSAYSGTAMAIIFDEDRENDELAYQFLLDSEKFLAEVEQYSLPIQYLVTKAYVLDGLKKYDLALDAIAQAEQVIKRSEGHFLTIPLLEMTSLKGMIKYDLGHFKEAYYLLEQYLAMQIEYTEAKKSVKASEISMQYEAKQAELQNKFLTQQAEIERVNVEESQRLSTNKKQFFLYFALVALIFGWLLYRMIRSQRVLIKAFKTDHLTQLANRHSILKQGKKLIAVAKLTHHDVVIMLVRCNINQSLANQLSHYQQQQNIIALSQSLNSFFTDATSIGRLSGNEFILLFTQSNVSGVKEQAKKYKETLMDSNRLNQTFTMPVEVHTASLLQNQCENIEQLLMFATRKFDDNCSKEHH